MTRSALWLNRSRCAAKKKLSVPDCARLVRSIFARGKVFSSQWTSAADDGGPSAA